MLRFSKFLSNLFGGLSLDQQLAEARSVGSQHGSEAVDAYMDGFEEAGQRRLQERIAILRGDVIDAPADLLSIPGPAHSVPKRKSAARRR